MITKERRQKLLWGIPLIVASLFAVFWGVWYLWYFSTSSFWGIVFALIWTIVMILLVAYKRRDVEDLFCLGLFCLVFSLVIGLSVGRVFGLGAGLVFFLVANLGAGLVFSLGLGLKFLFSRKFWAAATQ